MLAVSDLISLISTSEKTQANFQECPWTTDTFSWMFIYRLSNIGGLSLVGGPFTRGKFGQILSLDAVARKAAIVIDVAEELRYMFFFFQALTVKLPFLLAV
jgi:hypothetical protein